MNRRIAQLALLTGILVSLTIQTSLVSGSSASVTQWSGTHTASSAERSASPDPLLSGGNLYASSMEYEFPDPPPERERSFCESVPRLCQWFAHYDALIEPEPDESEDSSNESAVGWRSASISAMQGQERVAPVQLNVPSLSIEANVSGVGINADRSMQVPNDYNTVGWYKHGPAPGDTGSSVIAGHLDDSRGRSVFYDLQHVEIGAEVTVKLEDGAMQTFRITEKTSYDAGDIPADKIFSREGDPRLALITCGGKWDSSAGRYAETVVVYAEPT